VNDVMAREGAFGLLGLVVLLLVALSRPLRDKCWCEAFGAKPEGCNCVGFEAAPRSGRDQL
jgi:hypothetical protein